MSSVVPVALVLSGGGIRGALQAGFIQALVRTYPQFDIQKAYGVSVGSINAAAVSAGQIDRLDEFWSEIDSVWKILGFPSKADWKNGAFFSAGKLRRFIEKHLDMSKLISSHVLAECGVTGWNDGRAHYLCLQEYPHSAMDIILGSIALPGIYPMVDIPLHFGTLRAMDGGIVDNFPMRRAVSTFHRGIVIGMMSGYTVKPPKKSNPIFSLGHAVNSMMAEAVRIEMEEMRYNNSVLIIDTSPYDPFTHTFDITRDKVRLGLSLGQKIVDDYRDTLDYMISH